MEGRGVRLAIMFMTFSVLAVRPVLGFAQASFAAIGDTTIDRRALFRAVGSMYGLDPALLEAIATAESANDALAVSPEGAMGLMQLMPVTAARFSVANPFDPIDSTLGAARLLNFLRSHASCRDLPALIAAYNAGIGAVERYGGVPPYTETRQYVRRVLRLYLAGQPGSSMSNSPPREEHRRSIAKSQRIASDSPDQTMLDQLLELRRLRVAARETP